MDRGRTGIMRAFREAEQCLRSHVHLSRTAELMFTTSALAAFPFLNRDRARNPRRLLEACGALDQR
jgi:hypothetical protein